MVWVVLASNHPVTHLFEYVFLGLQQLVAQEVSICHEMGDLDLILGWRIPLENGASSILAWSITRTEGQMSLQDFLKT